MIDIDIFKDGHISGQGLDKVLSPVVVNTTSSKGRKLEEEEEVVAEERCPDTLIRKGEEIEY